MKKNYLFLYTLPLIIGLCNCTNQEKKERPNILMIIVDDLKPELGCYDKDYIISPNIDKLAAEAVIFDRAYCNIPVCGASRASMMTGKYPNRVTYTDFKTYMDLDAPGAVTLPEYFKNNGYNTLSFGKVFHHMDDALRSWSETPWRPDYPNDIHIQEYWRDYRAEENIWTKDTLMPGGAPGPAWESPDVPDNTYYDGKVAEKAVKQLEDLASGDQPFFLSVGLLKPHLPFNAPLKYWDGYSKSDIHLVPNPFMPENAPSAANFNSHELRAYTNIPKGTEPINDSLAYILKHGYYSSVSYIDAQIGNILQKLQETGLDENTIVVLWGDHGWSLGEHNHWGKHTCFHPSLKIPFLIKAPGVKASESSALVSLIDIYPTLCELTGIPMKEGVDGQSIVNILNDPSGKGKEQYSRFPNGETIVNERYLYTEYYNKQGNYISNMLYDLESDPLETVNIADMPESDMIVQDLRGKLRQHIKEVNSR